MTSTNLTDLPHEILLEIYSYLQEEKPSDVKERAAAAEEDWMPSADDWHDEEQPSLQTDEWRNEEHPSLQTLRAVNKHFNGIFSALLFESVVMLHHPESWNKINNIATSWLAPFVKTLRIATQGDLPVFKDIETWEEQVPLKRTPYDPLHAPVGWLGGWLGVVPNKQILWENPAAGGVMSKVDLGSRDKAYALYKYWADGEAAMRAMEGSENNRTAPMLRLDLLPNLKRFETVGHNDLATIKIKLAYRPNSCPCCRIERSYASRRSIEASPADESTIRTLCSRWRSVLGLPQLVSVIQAMPRLGIDWGHMKLFLRATTRCDIQITDLTLWDPRELGEVSNFAEIAFPSLRRLKVNLGRQIVGPVITSYSRASWVDKLYTLQELVIVRSDASWKGEFEGATRYEDIIRALYGARFPKLIALELRNIRSSFKSLEEFVQVHKRTLQSLCVVKPRMSEEDWTQLRSRYLNQEGVKTLVSTESMFQVALKVENPIGPLYTPVLKQDK
ncbi:MAG: hypothetical protein Q9195_004068 [Heterodermia aff. obscurata]